MHRDIHSMFRLMHHICLSMLLLQVSTVFTWMFSFYVNEQGVDKVSVNYMWLA